MRRLLKHLVCLLTYGTVGAAVALLVLYVLLLRWVEARVGSTAR